MSDLGFDTKQMVVETLRRRQGHTAFVSEIGAALERQGLKVDDLEEAIATLEKSGDVLVSSHYCGDPHLASVDLRITGLIDDAGPGEDAIGNTVGNIEAAWQVWVGEFLQNHQCS